MCFLQRIVVNRCTGCNHLKPINFYSNTGNFRRYLEKPVPLTIILQNKLTKIRSYILSFLLCTLSFIRPLFEVVKEGRILNFLSGYRRFYSILIIDVFIISPRCHQFDSGRFWDIFWRWSRKIGWIMMDMLPETFKTPLCEGHSSGIRLNLNELEIFLSWC